MGEMARLAISVVIPVSPIPSHPQTAILDETIRSIRYWLPDVEIIMCFDGVRREQEDRRTDYEEAMRRTLWKADHDPLWRPVVPFVFDIHHHQVKMMRAILDKIRTPLLLFVEQDCPLVYDCPIDWETICGMVLTGRSHCVRLHHEAQILDVHQHLMHGRDGMFLRTSQFSGRPHIASVDFYRRALAKFSANACCFIEDKLYGVISEAYVEDRMAGWNRWRVHIYAPPGGHIKRSVTTDGRAGAPKYDESQVF